MKKLSVIYDVTALCPWNCPICCMGASSDRSCLCNELTLEEKLSVVRQVRELSENGYDYDLVRVYEAGLFLSMMPFHMDQPGKVLGFLLNAIRIMEEVKESGI